MKKCLLSFLSIIALTSALNAEINVYFTHSVDTTLANPNQANAFTALDERLIERISHAQYTIDFCFYNIWRWNVADSLIAAHYRGTAVRVITEHDHINNAAVQNLINAGIPVIDDAYGVNSGDGFMHNKFAIFDFRDSTSNTDDWIWTGSYNVTDYGTESHANNTIEVQHHEISRAYTLEFEEMWGSKTNTPNQDSTRFQLLKTDNTEHSFLVDSIPVELYFSPSDHSTQEMISAVTSADSTIYFSIFAYTRQDLCDAMKSRWDSGISVKGVFDELDWLGYYSKSRDMTGDPSSNNPWVPSAPVFSDSVHSSWGPELLHHKYMIIDPDCNSTPLTITGSQNWSNNGEYYNDENTLIIQSSDIANQYLQEFVQRYREAGGEYVCIYDSEDKERKTDVRIQLEAYPNPFTAVTRFQVLGAKKGETYNLSLYDASGRRIKSFLLVPSNSQLTTEILWDAKGIAPGIYFIAIDHVSSEKLIKLR